jgi:hypothetical protein
MAFYAFHEKPGFCQVPFGDFSIYRYVDFIVTGMVPFAEEYSREWRENQVGKSLSCPPKQTVLYCLAATGGTGLPVGGLSTGGRSGYHAG